MALAQAGLSDLWLPWLPLGLDRLAGLPALPVPLAQLGLLAQRLLSLRLGLPVRLGLLAQAGLLCRCRPLLPSPSSNPHASSFGNELLLSCPRTNN